MANDILKNKISENIEISIEGMPPNIVTPKIQANAAMSLVKYGLPIIRGEIPAGLLGGIKVATLRVGSNFYQIRYTINIMKTITAIEAYKETIAWIKLQKEKHGVDSAMADKTIDYLHTKFKHDF